MATERPLCFPKILQGPTTLRKTVWEGSWSDAAFVPRTGTAEYFLILDSSESSGILRALETLHSQYEDFLSARNLTGQEIIFSRLYLSDIANQESVLPDSKLYRRLSAGAVSLIEQRPLKKGPVALFAYFATPFRQKLSRNVPNGKAGCPNESLVIGDHYRMLWLAAFKGDGIEDAEGQTGDLLKNATAALKDRNMRWLPNALRSWIFVRDIDADYEKMVRSRREFFHRHGLTDCTRYLASTGIEGQLSHPGSRVGMDMLCLDGLDPAQITKMEALDSLSSANMYGATFERGLRIDFGDRIHLHISGTASIGQSGELLHPRDVEKQTERTLQNLQALLAAQGSSYSDLAYVFVYLRDPTSESQVRRMLQPRLPPDLPRLFLEARVCRPGWLVEIEGFAVKSHASPFKPFF